MIDVMRHLAPGEEADVLTGLDALPDGARAAIPEVISRRPPQTIGIASPTDIEAFELTVERSAANQGSGVAQPDARLRTAAEGLERSP